MKGRVSLFSISDVLFGRHDAYVEEKNGEKVLLGERTFTGEQNQSLRTFWTRGYALDNRQEVVRQISKIAKDARAAKVLQVIK
jgi:hypothetical protein